MNRDISPVCEATLKAYIKSRRPTDHPIELAPNEYQATLRLLQNPGEQVNIAETYNLTDKGGKLVKGVVLGARTYQHRISRIGYI